MNSRVPIPATTPGPAREPGQRQSRLVAAGFVILLLVVATVIIRNQILTNQQVQRMFTESVQGIRVSGELMDRIQETRLYSLQTLGSTDPNVQLESADASRARDGQVSTLLREHAALIARTDAPVAAHQLEERWSRYLKVRDEVLAAVLEGNRDEAVKLDRQAVEVAFRFLHESLDASEAAHSRLADASLRRIKTVSRQNILTIGTLLGLVMLGAVLGLRTLGHHAQLLHRSRERFELAVAGSSDGIWDWHLETNTFFFSSRWKSMLGYADEELADTFASFEGLLHPEDAALVQERIRSYLGGQYPVYEVEFRLRHRDGTYRWILSRGVALRDAAGRPFRFAGSHTDITERKRLDGSLRDTLTMQRAIFDSASHAIVSTGLDGTVRSFNRAAEHMLGYTAGEVVGRSTPALWHDEAEVASRAAALSRELDVPVAPGFETFVAKARRDQPDENEWTLIRKDGSRLPVLISITAMREASGEITGVLGVIADITTRKAAETEMARLNRELVSISRQAGMAEVATSVLHNVGNVLNSVNVSATVVCDRLAKSRVAFLRKSVGLLQQHRDNLPAFLTTDPKGQALPGFLDKLTGHLEEENAGLRAEMEGVARHVEHIKQIVSAQQSYGRVFGVIEMLDPRALVEDAVGLNIESIERHGIALKREFASERAVTGDRHKILQILVNLLRNAKQAVIEASPAERRITVRLAESTPGTVNITVADTGMGISAENLAKIFQHGFTTKKDGHGFGLHSAVLAAREMKGDLTVHSDGPARGAAFTLQLPTDLRP